MKTFYIDESGPASLMIFKSVRTKYHKLYSEREEARHERNEQLFANAFQALQAGRISIFYTAHTDRDRRGVYYTQYHAFHRSPKTPGAIQESVYYTKHGEIVALSDAQHKTAADAIRHGIKSGLYIIRA